MGEMSDMGMMGMRGQAFFGREMVPIGGMEETADTITPWSSPS